MKRGLLLIACLVASSAHAADRKYTVLDIGGSLNGNFDYPVIGDSGMVAFTMDARDPVFLWSQQSGLLSLGYLPFGTISKVTGISSQGVVSCLGIQYGFEVGIVGDYAAGYHSLGFLSGGNMARSYGISQAGFAVGEAKNRWGLNRPVLWNNIGTPADISGLPESSGEGRANSASNGFVVGFIRQPSIPHAFRWTNQSGLTLLGQLNQEVSSVATDVNSLGEAVGVSADNQFGSAVYWDSNGTSTRLPEFFQYTSSAFAINDSRTIVGQSKFDINGVAAVWEGVATPFQLYSRIDPLTSDQWSGLDRAVDINNNGWIVGWGTRPGLGTRPYVAIPIPASENFKPTVWSLFRGQVINGGDLSFILNKDGQYMVTKPGLVLNQTEEPVQLVVDGTCPQTNVTELHCKATIGVNSPSLRLETFLLDWTTGNYVKVDERPVTQSDMDIDVNVSNPGNYIRPNDRLVRTKYAVKAVGPVTNPAWQARFDVTNWTVVLP